MHKAIMNRESRLSEQIISKVEAEELRNHIGSVVKFTAVFTSCVR